MASKLQLRGAELEVKSACREGAPAQPIDEAPHRATLFLPLKSPRSVQPQKGRRERGRRGGRDLGKLVTPGDVKMLVETLVDTYGRSRLTMAF